MFDFIAATPPETAVLLGLFMGLSLKRSRIGALLDHYLPATREADGQSDE